MKFDFLCQPPPRLDGRSRGGARPPILFQDETVPAAVADKITTGTLSVSSSVPTHLFWRTGQTVETFSGRFGTFSRPRKKRSSGFWFLLPDFFLVPERKKKLSQKWNNLLRPPQMTGFGTHFDRRRKKNKTENGGDDFPNYRIAPGNNGRSVYTLNTDQQ